MAFATIDVTKGITGVLPAANATYASLRPNAEPIIINGNMNVWQRSTSTVTMSDGYYNVDRFRGEEGTDGTATWSRSTSVPDNTGLAYSLQVDCTGTDSSIGSGQQTNIQQTIEAQNLQLLKWGTSDAEKVTLSFWVKSNQTGQHSVALRKLDNTAYNQPKTYTISSADTWEKKVLVFSALTLSGGAIANDNGDGLQIFWKLSAGSDYQGTADTWTATNQGATAVSGDVNFMSSTDNNFYLTGVQLEVGEYTSSTLPPFQHESLGDNLARCQRYFQMIAEGNQKIISMAHWGSSTEVDFVVELPTTMRARPTLDYTTGNEYWAIGGSGGSTNTLDNLNVNTWSTDSNINLWTTTGAGGTAGYAYYGYTNNASAKLGFTSEL